MHADPLGILLAWVATGFLIWIIGAVTGVTDEMNRVSEPFWFLIWVIVSVPVTLVAWPYMLFHMVVHLKKA